MITRNLWVWLELDQNQPNTTSSNLNSSNQPKQCWTKPSQQFAIKHLERSSPWLWALNPGKAPWALKPMALSAQLWSSQQPAEYLIMRFSAWERLGMICYDLYTYIHPTNSRNTPKILPKYQDPLFLSPLFPPTHSIKSTLHPRFWRLTTPTLHLSNPPEKLIISLSLYKTTLYHQNH